MRIRSINHNRKKFAVMGFTGQLNINSLALFLGRMSKPSIKEFIQKKIKEYNNSPASIEQLILDDKCKGGEIEGLTDAFTDLEVLSMNGIGLNSLAGLPKLPKLRRVNQINRSNFFFSTPP
jgi:hypothetical protein